MKKYIIASIITLSAILITLSGHAQQLKAFTATDLSKVPEEFISLLETNKAQGDLNKQYKKEFPLLWEQMSEEKRADFVKIGNNMLKKRVFRPYPHFANLANLYKAFCASDHEKEYKQFAQSLIYASSEKASVYEKLVNCYTGLLTEGVIFAGTAAKWKTENTNFVFLHDSVPAVQFDNITLDAEGLRQTLHIFETSGIYFPLRNVWEGQDGRVSWERNGDEAKDIEARLKNYTINMKQAGYEADSVTYTNPTYFDKPLLGHLEDKINTETVETKIFYPRFKSYDSRIKISDFYENVDVEGAIEMWGTRFMSSGDKTNLATATFYKNNKKVIGVSSSRFTLNKDKLSTDEGFCAIYLDADSIYHPDIHMTYTHSRKELMLLRGKDGLEAAPFYDSFHKTEIYVEALYWNLDKEYLDLRSLRGPIQESKAVFESMNYFDESRIKQLQVLSKENPLYTIYSHFVRNHVKVQSLKDMVRLFQSDPTDIRYLLINLAQSGFINYDYNTDEIRLLPKTTFYLMAQSKKKDYDVIQFNSKTEGSEKGNAVLNLMNFDIKISGIPYLSLSDSQAVRIYPNNAEIILKKNRNFEFSGNVVAGQFQFTAKNCLFDYDKFQLDMAVIDSVSFRVKEFDNPQGNYVKVQSTIQDISGVLSIDMPNNKSSVEQYPDYPIFESRSAGSVYYDKTTPYHKEYSRDRFYYRVNPFTIKDLVNFNTDSIEFNGYLVSGGIFPDIEKPLKVQSDYSLGFKYTTPTGGLPTYGGKGNYENLITLNNSGLRGNGKLDYLTSTVLSDEFKFFPDSTVAIANNYAMNSTQGESGRPDAHAQGANVHWDIQAEEMRVCSPQEGEALYLYGQEVRLEGCLVVKEEGTTGSGTLNYKKADFFSDNYVFKNNELFSDNTNVDIKATELGETELALQTENQRVHLDFSKKLCNFVSNGSASRVNFNVNKYSTQVDNFQWKIDQDMVSFNYKDNHPNVNIDNTPVRQLFTMRTPESRIYANQKSVGLDFTPTKADYNLKDYVIRCQGVKYIKTADAALIPEKGLVNIEKGKLHAFDNARLLIDTTTQYHEIKKVHAVIEDIDSYTANGEYTYVDEQKKEQTIVLDKVFVKNHHSEATGSIAETAAFTLSPNFPFNGDVHLYATDEFLSFSGNTIVSHGCYTTDSSYITLPFAFSAKIDPNKVAIPVTSNTKDSQGNRLANAILANRYNTLYAAFARAKAAPSDNEIISAFGILYFDKIKQAYCIRSERDYTDNTDFDNALSVGLQDCQFTAEGVMQLAPQLGRLNLISTGTLLHTPENNTLSTSIGLDFPLPKELTKILVSSLTIANASSIDASNSNSLQSLIRTIYTAPKSEKGKDKKQAEKAEADAQKAEQLIKELQSNFRFKKLPDELQLPFIIKDLDLKWIPQYRSFISEGNIDICIAGGEQIYKSFKGHIQIERLSKANRLTMYIDGGEYWFYFKYQNNVLTVSSDNQAFINAFAELKPDALKFSAENGKPALTIRKEAESVARAFLRRINTMTNNQGEVELEDEEEESEETPSTESTQPNNQPAPEENAE